MLWANQEAFSILVVVKAGFRIRSTHGSLLENKTSGQPQQSPPRGAIGTGQLGRLRFRAGPIAPRGGRHNIIFNIRCVRQGMPVIKKLLERSLLWVIVDDFVFNSQI